MNLWEILGEIKITHLYIILCIFNFGHCKLHFSSRTLHVRFALEWQYLFVVVGRPFPANQNVRNFQIFHISAGSLASSFCWYHVGSVKYYNFEIWQPISMYHTPNCLFLYGLSIYIQPHYLQYKRWPSFPNICIFSKHVVCDIVFMRGWKINHVKNSVYSAMLLISTV